MGTGAAGSSAAGATGSGYVDHTWGKVVTSGGCGCEVAQTRSGPGALLLLAGLFAVRRRRRRS